ncbi:hypothetical protein [Cryptosporangium phraense]|uniref:Uncharacterized protein n=1 Tax=Cryptosporangium phraense TaxID=2593070 RepID=A0A545APP3_9ACTN|nr:hypothetical protein [Cryptosporangium phraense]TQS43231.1 hypothetical protein FL583_20525 [Cryptosporangium phraense]
MPLLVRRFAGVAAVLVTLATVSACGGLGSDDDDQAVCDSVKEELRSVTTEAAAQVETPAVASETYQDGAARVRAFAKKAHGDVADASYDIADALNHLGGLLAVDGPPNNPATLDLTALNTAGAKLQSACA